MADQEDEIHVVPAAAAGGVQPGEDLQGAPEQPQGQEAGLPGPQEPEQEREKMPEQGGKGEAGDVMKNDQVVVVETSAEREEEVAVREEGREAPEPFEDFDRLSLELRQSLNKLTNGKPDPAHVESVVKGLLDIVTTYLAKNDPNIKANTVWELIRTVSSVFVEANIQSLLWHDHTLGLLAAKTLQCMLKENPEADVWETAQTLGKALTVIMDSVYIGSIKEQISMDKYLAVRPQVTELGRELHAACLKTSHELYYSGVIKKRGSRIKTWKKRFLTLDSKELHYTQKQEDGAEVTSRIPLCTILSVSKRQPPKANRPFCFNLTTANRVHVIEAPNAEELEKWVRHISAAVTALQGLMVSSYAMENDAEIEEEHIKKVVLEVIPSMVKESGASCTKILAALLSKELGQF